MKKIMILCLVLITIALSSTFCFNAYSTSYEIQSSNFVFYDDLNKIPRDYILEDAIKNGDIVFFFKSTYNVDKLETFYNRFKNKVLQNGDMIRLTGFTIEGDAIIQDLTYNNNSLKLVIDKTRDKFLSIEESIITEYKIVDIYTKGNKNIEYFVITNTGEELLLFYDFVN